ncbi:TetR/AcrR family transcriptional regulator [Sandaracinobacter neustonicus]|uniref:TetR/AcrR family transcriptional regulator n=1 Tax=Sandaracinobacter neustonicus TaxID=1715348 RepID=A0A501XVV6_9SPHN|nr:TetR/AcrR family transcriptional regulator [Sandaracinobacter neustonicus]TPE64453.1 TetR/AcrR family transcriptional regulator [Sandaracinobacter neustonicus]
MQNYVPKAETTPRAGARARGRPRAFDREAALEQATRLFWAKGFEATSITDLTQAMGIGAPSLYAAFQSKEALYAEALDHYARTNEGYVWCGFHSAPTAREAVRRLLMDSAAVLTGCVIDSPRGCMVTLSSVGSEGHQQLGELVRSARGITFQRLLGRLQTAVADGEIPPETNLEGLARFVQALQNGMSIMARDGVGRADLEAVADVAMVGWDARIGAAPA